MSRATALGRKHFKIVRGRDFQNSLIKFLVTFNKDADLESASSVTSIMTCISSVYLLLTWNIVGARKTPLWSVAFQNPGREPSFCLFSRFAGLLATFSDICLAKETSYNMKYRWYSAFRNILFGQMSIVEMHDKDITYIPNSHQQNND